MLDRSSVLRIKINIFILIIGLISVSKSDAQNFYVFDISTHPKENCFPTAINDSGRVIGYYKRIRSTLKTRAFLTGPNGTRKIDIGTLGGDAAKAYGVNSSGQVVGVSLVGPNPTLFAGFITDADGKNMRLLNPFPPFLTIGYGISEDGRVVGQLTKPEGSWGFVTGPNGEGGTQLNGLGGAYGYAVAINSKGQILGRSEPFAPGDTHAYITGPNGNGITDIGLLGGFGNVPRGLNENGQVTGVIGYSYNIYRQYVTDANGANIKDLGTLSGKPESRSEAGGINEAGIVVGASTRNGNYHSGGPTLTVPSGRTIDLNRFIANLPSGVSIAETFGINAKGQIAAKGTDLRCYIICPDKHCSRSE